MAFSRNRGSDSLHSATMARYGRVAALAAIAIGASASACGTSASEPAGKPGDHPAVQPAAYVPIARGAHPLARPELDRGALDPAKVISNLSVVFKPTPAQIAERDALIAAQLTPGSPSYHQWLTPESYAARFGASADTIARTKAWLAQQGLTVHEASPLGSRVTFSGRVADLQAAFHAPMRQYEVEGKLHYAMSTAPSVPADLADAVLAIHNTHDFYLHPMVKLGSVRKPETKNGFQVGFGPPDWANVYDVTKLYTQGTSGTPVDGTGVTIGIVGIAQVGQSDIDQFRTKFGLPASTVTMTLVPNTGPATPGGATQSPGSGVEAYLDVEWSGGIAKGATVNYVFTGVNDPNVDDATYYAIEHNLAGILSESWGGCEYSLTPGDADIVAVYGSAAELLGITYVASSGDSGAETCLGQANGLYVDIPAAYPSVTGVGGTEFPSGSITYGSNGYAVGYSTQEECWNEGNQPPYVGAGGGGISSVFTRPSYQTAPTCTMVGTLPTSANPATMRMVPDVAFNAASNSNPDFIMCKISGQDCAVDGTGDTLQAVGGTSASAPAFAGVVAVLTQAAGGGRLGNINPLLYALSTSAPAGFHDIVNGNNEIRCMSGTDPGCPAGGLFGFPATTGYDCATGLGSLDVYNLAVAWAALAPTTTALAATPTTTTPGGAIKLTATVDVTKPNTDALGGAVRFNFQSYSADGTPDLSWTIGGQTITPGSPATANGTAILSGPVPVGLVNPAAQYVDVVAMYGGDAYHLASNSPKVRITFSTTTNFCLVPSLGTIQPSESFTFSSTGGAAPVKWYIGADSTCDQNGNCSKIDQTSGAFTAGPTAGYVVVVALDANGSEQVANLIVGDPGVDSGVPPWGDAQAPLGGCNAPIPDAGITFGGPEAGVTDDGSAPIVDSGTTTVVDSSAPATDGSTPVDASGTDDGPVVVTEGGGDSGPSGPSSVKAGCGCKVVASTRGGPAGAFAGLGLGMGLLIRRRRRARG